MRAVRLPRLRRPRTVRGRLAAVLVLVLTLGFVVAALVTTLLVRHVLLTRVDAQLRAAGDRFAVSLEHDDHDADNDDFGDVEGQAAGTLGARVFRGRVTDAAVVGDHDAARGVPASARRQLAGLRVDHSPRALTLDGLGDYRVVVTAGRDGDVQITGLPAEPIEHTIDTLVEVVFAVYSLALLIVVVTATGLLGIMLRPLSRMSTTAAQVAQLPLGTGGVDLPHRVDARAAGSEIDTLAAAFNAMLERVEEALRTRADSEERLRRFIADASHELRTPIAVICAHAELALREIDTVPAPIGHSLGRITAQSERMSRLVEDLLLLARLDSGRPLADERADIVRIVLDAVADARIAHATHRWQLHLPEGGLEIRGDPHALGQVVANLLANAAVHTPAGTRVSVSLAPSAATAQLVVADNGPGIDPAVLPYAFDRFVRGTGRRSTGAGSSGLGLPIVAAIVAALDGEVDAASTPGGTMVTVRLPATLHADAETVAY